MRMHVEVKKLRDERNKNICCEVTDDAIAETRELGLYQETRSRREREREGGMVKQDRRDSGGWRRQRIQYGC